MVLVPPFLGPGCRLGARWNRLGETVKTRKKREKTGGKMGEIWSKKCEQGRDRRDHLSASAARTEYLCETARSMSTVRGAAAA